MKNAVGSRAELSRMTAANWITLARLMIAVSGAFSLNLKIGHRPADIVLVLFSVSVALDKVDGLVARRVGSCTNLGKFLDTLVDKIVLATFFLCLLDLRIIPLALAAAAIVRDLLMQGFRSYAVERGVFIRTYLLSNLRYLAQVGSVLAGLSGFSSLASVVGSAVFLSLSLWLFIAGLGLGYASLVLIVVRHKHEVFA